MIFSRKPGKEKVIEKPKVIADYREKNAMVISELTSLGIDVEVKSLKSQIISSMELQSKEKLSLISSIP